MGYLHHITPPHSCRTPQVDGRDGTGTFWQCDECQMTWALAAGGWRELRCRLVRQRRVSRPDTWELDHGDVYWLQRLWEAVGGE